MNISRIAPEDGGMPWVPALTLGEAKRHCNVYHAEDDALIEALVATAQAHIEGADGTGGHVGRAVSRHMLELRLERFPPSRQIPLPHPPLVSVTSIDYTDVAGLTQTLSSSAYHVVPDNMQGFIRLRQFSEWPDTDIRPDAVRIRFVCGPAACPADLKHAMLLHIGHLYVNREAVGDTMTPLPLAYKSLVDPHRTHGWI